MTKIQTEIPEERGVIETVIKTVAEAKGVHPVELTPPLYEAIDPEALDCIFAGVPAIGKVTFNYNRNEISVFSDGYVAVEMHDR